MASSPRSVWTCTSCLRAQARRHAPISAATSTPLLAQTARISQQSSPCPSHSQPFSTTQRILDDKPPPSNPQPSPPPAQEKEQGALSRRLQDLAEETINTGSKSDRTLLSQNTPGFSQDLKAQLEQRIAESSFQAANQQAISQTTLPSSAGKGTRDHAAAQPWSGQESLADASLRMLDDSHKRLRMPARKPTLGGSSRPIRPPSIGKGKVNVADRLASAREKTSVYTLTKEQENAMSEEERQRFKQELKDRFSPGARPMPTTLQGLTSLANERIEDAIARGQFRNIQRGKGVNIERDYTANSPFLDTTEYFMNKIIQKQEIVPPWIEKQQELMKMVNTFRGRMRADWRRHAARMISSKGGTVEDQVRRAKSYALAEERDNPRPAMRSEGLSAIDSTGNLTTITIEERIAAGVAPDQGFDVDKPVEIKVVETPAAASPSPSSPIGPATAEDHDKLVTQILDPSSPRPAHNTATIQISSSKADPNPSAAASPDSADENVAAAANPASASTPPAKILPMSHPFRDPAWEATEHAYHTLAISELNSLTRSYNLMAPKIAQKPYYTLQRELNRCYAEVAPLLPDEILERSRKPVVKVSVSMHKPGGVMERFAGGKEYQGHVAEKVRDEGEEKSYGFKQFWKDLFERGDGGGKRRAV